MPNISDHYPYDKIIHLNGIDDIIKEDLLLSVTFQHQIHFTSTSQVRKYIKDRGTTPGKDDNPFDLVTVMMEAFFGHYSTSLLNQSELVTMWSKLFVNSIDRLYLQNILIVPEDKRDTEEHFESYIEAATVHAEEMAIAETEPYSQERKLLKKEYLDRVTDKYRSKTELAILFSKFTFMMGSRFYTPPIHKSPEILKKYITLRANIINAWCDMVGIEVLKNVNPDLSFFTIEPKSVAFKVFPPDAQYDNNQLRDRKRKFDNWFDRERDLALQKAEETGDFNYKADIRRQWRVARAYGNLLHDALVPRAQAITDGEAEEDADFIVNDNENADEEFQVQSSDDEQEDDHDYESDEGDDDEELTEEENARIQQEQEQLLSLFRHVNDIDEQAAEASSLGYDNYVAQQLALQDAQAQQSIFEDVVEEADSDEEDDGDYVMDDGDAYLEDYNEHMNTDADGADMKRSSYKNALRVTEIPISRGTATTSN